LNLPSTLTSPDDIPHIPAKSKPKGADRNERIRHHVEMISQNVPGSSGVSFQLFSLTRREVKRLAEAISENYTLESLDLSNRALKSPDSDLPLLFPLFASHPNLQSIDLRLNGLSVKTIRELESCVKNNLVIQYIHVVNSSSVDSLPSDMRKAKFALDWYLSLNRSLVDCHETAAAAAILEGRGVNDLRSILPRLRKPEALRSLNVANNKIAFLPEPEIGQFLHLRELVLHHNQLTSLPAALGRLRTLRKLDLSHNKLRSPLPDALRSLRRLTSLDFSYNKLTSLPSFLGRLPDLRVLRLNGNSLKNSLKDNTLPREFLQTPRDDDLLQYLREHSPQTGVVYRMRLLVVGDDQVGKRSLVKSLVHKPDSGGKLPTALAEEEGDESQALAQGKSRAATSLVPISGAGLLRRTSSGRSGAAQFGGDTRARSASVAGPAAFSAAGSGDSRQGSAITSTSDGARTIGANITSFTLRPKYLPSCDGDTVQVHVTELHDHGQFYAVHEQLARQATVCVIVFDLRNESYEQVEYWLEYLSRQAPNSPVIICATHADDRQAGSSAFVNRVFGELQQRFLRFDSLQTLFAVSNRTAKGIADLRSFLAGLALQLPEVRVEAAASLLDAEACLMAAALNDPKQRVMTWNSFSQFLAGCGVDDSQESVENAFSTLSSLGCVTRYTTLEKEEFQNLIIVDPLWLSDVFGSMVLRSGNTVSTRCRLIKDGVLNGVDFCRVWRGPQFDKHHEFIMALLLHLKVAFSLASDGERMESSGPPTPRSPLSVRSSPRSNSSEQVVLQTCRLFIPSLLSPDRRALTVKGTKGRKNLRSQWDRYIDKKTHFFLQELGRIYNFSYVAPDFFAQVLVRFLASGEWIPLEYWRCGMVLNAASDQCDSPRTLNLLRPASSVRTSTPTTIRLHASSSGENVAAAANASSIKIKIELDRMHGRLELRLRGSGEPVGQHILSAIDQLDALIAQRLPQASVTVTVPCTHCLTELPHDMPYLFGLRACQTAVAGGEKHMLCCGEIPVGVQHLVPDLALRGVRGGKIKFAELEILDMIGEGAFAKVYRGRWRDRTVAVKKINVASIVSESQGDDTPQELSPEELEEDKERMLAVFDSFRREAALISALQHHNIVDLLGVVMEGETMCLVLEFMSLGSLYDFLQNSEYVLDADLRLALALDVANAIDFMHAQKMIHRDIKSPNILLTETQVGDRHQVVAKVADFGLSRKLLLAPELNERVVDNPTWLAPEIITNSSYTGKADVYSFAIIMWELLTRTKPYSEMEFMWEIQEAIVNNERPPIPTDCDPDYASLMRDCWHPDPDKRPTFGEVVQRLTEMVRRRDSESESGHEEHLGARSARNGLLADSDESTSASNATSHQTTNDDDDDDDDNENDDVPPPKPSRSVITSRSLRTLHRRSGSLTGIRHQGISPRHADPSGAPPPVPNKPWLLISRQTSMRFSQESNLVSHGGVQAQQGPTKQLRAVKSHARLSMNMDSLGHMPARARGGKRGFVPESALRHCPVVVGGPSSSPRDTRPLPPLPGKPLPAPPSPKKREPAPPAGRGQGRNAMKVIRRPIPPVPIRTSASSSANSSDTSPPTERRISFREPDSGEQSQVSGPSVSASTSVSASASAFTAAPTSASASTVEHLSVDRNSTEAITAAGSTLAVASSSTSSSANESAAAAAAATSRTSSSSSPVKDSSTSKRPDSQLSATKSKRPDSQLSRSSSGGSSGGVGGVRFQDEVEAEQLAKLSEQHPGGAFPGINFHDESSSDLLAAAAAAEAPETKSKRKPAVSVVWGTLRARTRKRKEKDDQRKRQQREMVRQESIGKDKFSALKSRWQQETAAAAAAEETKASSSSSSSKRKSSKRLSSFKSR